MVTVAPFRRVLLNMCVLLSCAHRYPFVLSSAVRMLIVHARYGFPKFAQMPIVAVE